MRGLQGYAMMVVAISIGAAIYNKYVEARI